MTYWPLIQDRDNYLCIRAFFSDSYDSLVLDQAIRGTTAILGTVVAAFAIVFSM